jgi:C1A family cysteine protease
MTNPHGGYGWRRSLPDHRDAPFTAALMARLPTTLPAHRDDRGTKYMPPVYNQGQTSSCTGNGTAGALQYMRRKQGLADFVPSRMFIYYNGRAIDGTTSFDGGSQVRNVIKAVATQGACDETEWPFRTDQINMRPADKCYFDARTDLVTGYAAVPQNIDPFRACISDDKPIVFGFMVYSQFESDAMAQSGMLEMPDENAAPIGAHCVLACGFSDRSKVIICRNSWGKTWGDDGYFYMPYNYIVNPGLAADFWQIDLVTGR